MGTALVRVTGKKRLFGTVSCTGGKVPLEHPGLVLRSMECTLKTTTATESSQNHCFQHLQCTSVSNTTFLWKITHQRANWFIPDLLSSEEIMLEMKLKAPSGWTIIKQTNKAPAIICQGLVWNKELLFEPLRKGITQSVWGWGPYSSIQLGWQVRHCNSRDTPNSLDTRSSCTTQQTWRHSGKPINRGGGEWARRRPVLNIAFLLSFFFWIVPL